MPANRGPFRQRLTGPGTTVYIRCKSEQIASSLEAPLGCEFVVSVRALVSGNAYRHRIDGEKRLLHSHPEIW